MSSTPRLAAGEALYLLGFSPCLQREGARETEAECDPHDAELDAATTDILNHLGVHQVEAGSVWAWYKQIERNDFDGPDSEKNLANLSWLTPRVLAHETVVANLSSRWAFYPARFGTLFSSHSTLAEFALRQTQTLLEFFAQVRGKREWGIKFFGDTVRAAELIALKNGILQNDKPTNGANYLKLRQLQRQHTQSTQELFDESYRLAYQSMESRFGPMASRPLHMSGAGAQTEELIGSLAILSDESASQELAQWVIDWNSREQHHTAIRCEITGPWPAYSFCPSLSSLPACSEAA